MPGSCPSSPSAPGRQPPLNSKGVILMTAGDGESLVALAIGKDIKSVTVAAEKKGVTVKGEDLEKHRLRRARKGCQVQVKGPVRGIETRGSSDSRS